MVHKRKLPDKEKCKHRNTSLTYSSMFDWCNDCNGFVLKKEIRKQKKRN